MSWRRGPVLEGPYYDGPTRLPLKGSLKGDIGPYSSCIKGSLKGDIGQCRGIFSSIRAMYGLSLAILGVFSALGVMGPLG